MSCLKNFHYCCHFDEFNRVKMKWHALNADVFSISLLTNCIIHEYVSLITNFVFQKGNIRGQCTFEQIHLIWFEVITRHGYPNQYSEQMLLCLQFIALFGDRKGTYNQHQYKWSPFDFCCFQTFLLHSAINIRIDDWKNFICNCKSWTSSYLENCWHCEKKFRLTPIYPVKSPRWFHRNHITSANVTSYLGAQEPWQVNIFVFSNVNQSCVNGFLLLW